MKRYGLIGEKLGHSYSKIIHEQLADYTYDLIPLSKEEFAPFMEKHEFTAINVTIPYTQDVIPYLDEISDAAKTIGAVNCIVNKNGRLYGHNTDYA
ncbi:MAG: shikimate dehydrogenase, partial [Lachnospiraceae bacterium]|nr:shikimate dehydrogenase [Lachnospiraceae bacterium]